MSDNLFDVVSGRSTPQPTPVSVVGGRVVLPPDTTVDFRRVALLVKENFLDGVETNNNLIQGIFLDEEPNVISGNVTRSLMASCRNCTLTDTDIATMLSSDACTQTGTNRSAITGSGVCWMDVRNGNEVTSCSINNSRSSTIEVASGNTDPDSEVTYSSIDSALTARIRANDGNCQYCSISGSGSCSINNCTASALIGATAIDMTSCAHCVAGGYNTVIYQKNQLFQWGGTISALWGYCRSVYNIPGPALTLTYQFDTYIAGENCIVTLPLASNFATSYQAYFQDSSVRRFTLVAPFPYILHVKTTSPDVFNGKPGYDDHLIFPGTSLDIDFFYTAVPRWGVVGKQDVEAVVYASTHNNFGTTPPASDANQLPTAATELDHKALGSTSYYSFMTNDTLYENAFTVTSGALVINIAGVYRFTYSIQIIGGGAGATDYEFQADVADVTTPATPESVDGSYTKTAGVNSLSQGSQIVTWTSGYWACDTVPRTIVLRMSSTSNTLDANADIGYVRMSVSGTI